MRVEGIFLRGVSPNRAANDSTEPHGFMERVGSRSCPNDSTRAKRKNEKRQNTPQAKKPKKKKKKKKKKARRAFACILSI